jgi:hypothetical protein
MLPDHMYAMRPSNAIEMTNLSVRNQFGPLAISVRNFLHRQINCNVPAKKDECRVQ